MTPLLEKKDSGWRCLKCSVDISGLMDAKVHAVYFHRVHETFLAVDPDGNIFDGREVNLEDLRRAGL